MRLSIPITRFVIECWSTPSSGTQGARIYNTHPDRIWSLCQPNVVQRPYSSVRAVLLADEQKAGIWGICGVSFQPTPNSGCLLASLVSARYSYSRVFFDPDLMILSGAEIGSTMIDSGFHTSRRRAQGGGHFLEDDVRAVAVQMRNDIGFQARKLNSESQGRIHLALGWISPCVRHAITLDTLP